VRYALTIVFLALFTASAAEAARICPPESPVEKLKAISARMRAARDRLQADHHGVQVQVPQRKIVEELDRLIKELSRGQEERDRPTCPRPGDPRKGPRKPRTGPRTAGPPGGGNDPSRPMDYEGMTRGGIVRGIKALIGARGGEWGELPHKPRLRILQACRSRMPERYRKMLIIYWAALGEEGHR
jgi:hypothetical protein